MQKQIRAVFQAAILTPDGPATMEEADEVIAAVNAEYPELDFAFHGWKGPTGRPTVWFLTADAEYADEQVIYSDGETGNIETGAMTGEVVQTGRV